MTECEYGEYCLCGTCRYQTIEEEKHNCCECVDCRRENRQVHDVWACSKYERRKELMTQRVLSPEEFLTAMMQIWNNIEGAEKCQTMQR